MYDLYEEKNVETTGIGSMILRGSIRIIEPYCVGLPALQSILALHTLSTL